MTEVASHSMTSMYIGGEWVPSESGEWFETKNPTTGEALARFPKGTRADVLRAIEAGAVFEVADRPSPFVLGPPALGRVFATYDEMTPDAVSAIVDEADVASGDIAIYAWDNFEAERANEFGEIVARQALGVAYYGGALLPAEDMHHHGIGTLPAGGDYDLILASQPWRARMNADFKVKHVLAPLAKSLRPGGGLLTAQSSGDDPGLELVRKIWPDEDPFQVDRHELIKVLKDACDLRFDSFQPCRGAGAENTKGGD